jgi:hypothetical protein
MGLDIYVMPIWKFKAGNFRSPLEKIGLTPVTVTPEGTVRQCRPPGFIQRWQGRRATRRLRREIEAEIGHAVRWNDEGAVALVEQGSAFESLRAFAKWQDCLDQLPTFDPPPENNYYNHPAMSADPDRPLSYPQLVEHSCFSGYFIPAELERVVHVEPYRSFGDFVFHRAVGSSFRLLEELRQLSGVLGIEGDGIWQEADPLAEVKAAFAQLHKAAKISVEQDLPIVFFG